ncbi:MAG: aromatic ring-hydroxylating oxygenase subunit alpha [Methyloligellaceae bacterium]
MKDTNLRLPAGDVANARAPLETARSMPAGFYTSPEIFENERRNIFLKHWFFVGRTDELPNPGDYRAFETVGGPAILIRGEDGNLRAFANFCRHRGSILLEGEGNCKRVVCPYHAWSYFIDGQLYGCPDMEDAEGFDRVENGLVPIRMETWAGFVFLTFDADAPPLLDHLGDMTERMASHRLEDMRCTWEIELECACNWKLLLENAMETYHTGTVHRDSVGAQTSRTIETQGDWLCIQVLSGRSIATLPGAAPSFPSIAGLDEDAQQGTYFTVIHPTCQFAVAQDCMWWLNVLPRAENSTLLEIGGCFPHDAVDDPDFETKARPYYERWEQVGREDVSILERQQTALQSVLYRPGPLSGRDDQVQAIGIWVLDRLGL